MRLQMLNTGLTAAIAGTRLENLGPHWAAILPGHAVGLAAATIYAVALGRIRDQNRRSRHGHKLSAQENGTRVVDPATEQAMTKKNTGPEHAGAVTGGSAKNGSAADRGTASRHTAHRPVSKKSEAIIKEVSVRRRTAMKILASRWRPLTAQVSSGRSSGPITATTHPPPDRGHSRPHHRHQLRLCGRQQADGRLPRGTAMPWRPKLFSLSPSPISSGMISACLHPRTRETRNPIMHHHP